jgi:hypothetical protein
MKSFVEVASTKMGQWFVISTLTILTVSTLFALLGTNFRGLNDASTSPLSGGRPVTSKNNSFTESNLATSGLTK